MGALCGKTWIRVLALSLFFVSVTVSVLALSLYTFALKDGWYGKDGFTFADSAFCRTYVNQNLYYVEQNIEWLGDPGDTSLGGYGGTAFSYVVTSIGSGEIMADTRTDRSCFVMDYSGTVEIGDVSMYRLSGYVNLPVQPYEGCYAEYYSFEQLFPLRGLFLPILVIAAVLTVATLAFSIGAAAVTGRQGTVTVMGRAPFDLAAVCLILAVSVLTDRIVLFLGNIIEVHGIDIMFRVGIDYGTLRRIIGTWALVLGLCCLINQLTTHTFRQRLLLRRMIMKASPLYLTLVLLAAHGAALALVLAMSHDEQIKVILCLILFDAALIPCAIRWYTEGKRVRSAAKALAAGDLSAKVDAAKLHMEWRELGQDLGRIGDGMALAVEEQMRSERLKTELITNVSHDLKTPLTSIINYIDLLREPSLPEETRRDYLQILERQSAKLKKLTEDVVEASKAASGAVKVNAELFDVGELLDQSVGEYAERLRDTGIEPVIHIPESETYLLADPRLLGRVLDNFITNIIKYAQPGTRAYFDLDAGPEETVIEVKNTSREPLDIPAEELMERFIRGDSSRSSEGSGLGLSIARSLTELMGGQMQLTLDGDLFKAEVRFPPTAPPDGNTGPAEEPTEQN